VHNDLAELRSQIEAGHVELRIETRSKKTGSVKKWAEVVADPEGDHWNVKVTFGDGASFNKAIPAAEVESALIELLFTLRDGMIQKKALS
jgi:hypothetical protein